MRIKVFRVAVNLSLFFYLISCDSLSLAILGGHDVDLKNYTGKWIYNYTSYQGTSMYDSNNYLQLYSDSSFYSNFSFFHSLDTLTGSQSISGKWYPYLGADDSDNFYTTLYFTVDSVKKGWDVISKNDSVMTWGTDNRGTVKFKWQKVR